MRAVQIFIEELTTARREKVAAANAALGSPAAGPPTARKQQSAPKRPDLGQEAGTTVTPDYTADNSRSTGKISWVQIDLGTDDHDHLIDPDERVRIAMAGQ